MTKISSSASSCRAYSARVDSRRRASSRLRIDNHVKRPAAVLLFCLLAAAQGPTEPTGQPPVTPETLAAGERIFRTQCAYCHGDRGEGGRGPVLALFNLSARGIPESEMPGFWLTAREIWQVAAFVRTLGQVPVEKISGDPV